MVAIERSKPLKLALACAPARLQWSKPAFHLFNPAGLHPPPSHKAVPASLAERNQGRCEAAHISNCAPALQLKVMAPETHEHSLESPGDLRTDYLLIAVGAVAALIALIYLLLT
jgi:hypothetical protein